MKAHEGLMAELDKMGTHLKYFSQKQDVVLVKNLLSTVQHRWEKATLRLAERARQLDRADHEARQFREAWLALDVWLDASERSLDADATNQISTVDPDAIRAQIARHKEFQRALGSKQSSLDNVNRAGRTLKERCSKNDVEELQDMLTKLKAKWNALCVKSVDRYKLFRLVDFKYVVLL
jgi:dystonin